MTTSENIYESLERIFHEPNRLAIMSALCGADKRSLAFNELKTVCRLTDGNLNRHLKVLEESGAVKIGKSFVDDKPRTTIIMTSKGLQRFHQYLEALSQVLQHAQRTMPDGETAGFPLAMARRGEA